MQMNVKNSDASSVELAPFLEGCGSGPSYTPVKTSNDVWPPFQGKLAFPAGGCSATGLPAALTQQHQLQRQSSGHLWGTGKPDLPTRQPQGVPGRPAVFPRLPPSSPKLLREGPRVTMLTISSVVWSLAWAPGVWSLGTEGPRVTMLTISSVLWSLAWAPGVWWLCTEGPVLSAEGETPWSRDIRSTVGSLLVRSQTHCSY
uniref:Uncharacterized protein n=1 Tax=Molossus molossus TaxID=27622 RepID=A0A7J8F945_MOLMO|nr:hypothetical protein HJG59_008461 [Molossus molossus]